VANKKISELTNADALAGTEEFPVTQGGDTKAASLSQVSTYLSSTYAPARLIAETHADTTAANTAAETALVTLALPSDAQPGDVYRLVASGNLLQNSGGSLNYTWKLNIGATAALTSPTAAVGDSGTRRKWMMEAFIHVGATVAAQRVNAFMSITTASAASWQANSFGYTGDGSAAEDLAAGKNVTLTVTMSSANTLVDAVCTHAHLVKVGKAP
jgi:hypothetical protein